MEESVTRVLYETSFHASRPYLSNYPPQQAKERVQGGSLLSLLPGVTQFRERWSEYRHPKKLKKCISLFISRSGERVAVASGNQITFLRKEDNYQEAFGIFTSSSDVTFSTGTWSESHDVLGVVDDADTLYFIKANGEELRSISRKHLKVPLPVIGLIAQDDSDKQKPILCSFIVVTSDGSLQHAEISQNPSTSNSTTGISNIVLTVKRPLPNNIFCFDYQSESSLLAVVSSSISTSLTSSENSGSCYLSLWRRSGMLDLEQLCFTQFEGIYSKPKGYKGQLAYPKVLISPHCKFVATLDATGCVYVFKLDKECCSVLSFASKERCDPQLADNLSSEGRNVLSGIVDLTWWTDDILTLAKNRGIVAMVNITDGLKVQESDPVYSMPVLERVQEIQGNLFVLESRLSEERYNSSNHGEADDSHNIELITEDRFNQYDISSLRWRLISFSERSIPDMYNILIGKKEYQAALDFANCHGLDKDEVLKAQWLNSAQGLKEISMFLSNVKDQVFVISECVDKVAPTEDAVKALLSYGLRLTNQYRFSEVEDNECSQTWDFRMARLQLLQFRDRLETYLGINMGRFSVQEYSKFRAIHISAAAIALAESGKIGALNLLFKRHPYSISPSMFEILAAVPETVPVQTYGQLLPGRTPPTGTAVREEDWVECGKMVNYINRLPENHEIGIQIKTEPMVKRLLGSFWPSVDELSMWYKNRARDVDSFSGQLDNCLSLVDFACRKGIYELKQFHEDVSYLHQLIYSDDNDDEMNFSMSLVAWEQLSDYEKFRMMLKGVKEKNVIERLRDHAIPFMQKRCHELNSNQVAQSFLVKWLKEIATENKLDLCLIVIEEGSKDLETTRFFEDEAEAVDCGLQCIYSCTVMDRWNTMASILSKLSQIQGSEYRIEGLEKRFKLAEGHIEAGRLLAYYQVPKPVNFFLEAHNDEKGVKQILRLILSKFIRRQPGRSDNDWANMWRDMQSLREKAFPFLDLEYMLMEYCRGLLKAGKFPLARNYLKGTSSVALALEKAENLVIQAAREYFFSASSLSCSEIEKAKECLNLFPSSRNVQAELDIIEALTTKLPNLGVTILPMQFRQIKDPMEIIKMAISCQAVAYLDVDELIEVSKLLGLTSPDEISAVEEAIAREAAVAGDLQLAFDLCLTLARKGHGLIWDLCAAIARGPALENMDTSSRKHLLGFALSHCDEESISELLHAWKDLDLQAQCETLMMLTGTDSPTFSHQNSPVASFAAFHNRTDSSGLAEDLFDDSLEVHSNDIQKMFSTVAKSLPDEKGTNWESILKEDGKVSSFCSLQLPWLLELSGKGLHGSKLIPEKQYASVRTQALMTILSWLARNGFAPKDDLIADLAKSIIEPSVSEEEDVIGCSFLLNLLDPSSGVEIIEEQLGNRKDYQEICSIMNVGMIYSLLHNSGVECEGPAQRRELLLKKFKEKHTALSSDELDQIDEVQSTFWREWKLKIEEQKRVADHSRTLEQIIPGVDTARFLSGDLTYIESVVLSLVDSVKLEKKHILKDVLRLVQTYALNRAEVLLRYLCSILTSEVWTNDDIESEISEVKGEILGYASETVKALSLVVYPAINGCNKQRLAYVFGLLSECYLQLEETRESQSTILPDPAHLSNLELPRLYLYIGQECARVSFIKDLNFKNIAGLDGLNLECFSNEVYTHIDESSLEALAKMVRVFSGIYADSGPEGLISWQDVYKHYLLGLLKSLETKAKTDMKIDSPDDLQRLISQLEHTYNRCRTYIRLLACSDCFDIMKKYFTIVVPLYGSWESLPDNSSWQECLIILLSFWIKLADEMQDIASRDDSEETVKFNPESLICFLKIFMRLVVEDSISPSQGWGTILGYLNHGMIGDFSREIFTFCREMIFSGCGFSSVAEVFSEAVSQCPSYDTEFPDLPRLYLHILEPILQDLVSETANRQNLFQLLSSLSKFENDLELLNSVRHAVWGRMAKFSDNLQLPNHVRVYVLELMQHITGRNIKGFSAEFQSRVLPWESWDESSHYTDKESDAVPNQTDPSSKFTSTLVALKSSQLAAAISPSIEITTDDLVNIDTAVSCFLKLCGTTNTDAHFDALLAILGEWEGLFEIGRRDEETSSPKASSGLGTNWGNDDWDEGWDSSQETEPEEKKTKESSFSVHPLHACWVAIFEKFITLSRFRDILRLIDLSLSKSSGTLLDENEATSLNQIILGIDCFIALKVSLLFPYEAIRTQCLDSVEEKLKQGGISDAISRDLEFLTLILSSRLVSTIITKSSYGTTFSYVCFLVGNLSRQCLESKLSNPTQNRNNELLFRKIVFPSFVSELVMADQQVLAGFMVTKFMHTNASLRLVNIADASVSRYLKQQLAALEDDELASKETGSCDALKNSVSNMRIKLGNLIRSALALVR